MMAEMAAVLNGVSMQQEGRKGGSAGMRGLCERRPDMTCWAIPLWPPRRPGGPPPLHTHTSTHTHTRAHTPTPTPTHPCRYLHAFARKLIMSVGKILALLLDQVHSGGSELGSREHSKHCAPPAAAALVIPPAPFMPTHPRSPTAVTTHPSTAPAPH